MIDDADQGRKLWIYAKSGPHVLSLIGVHKDDQVHQSHHSLRELYLYEFGDFCFRVSNVIKALIILEIWTK